jgi:hypothetical protein
MLMDRLSGLPRHVTRESLANAFQISAGAALVLSGTDVDSSLERWWSVRDKGPLLEALVNVRPALVTTPNYSLPVNVPRHDNLHSIKRIGISCVELGAAGLPIALHLNARTDADWDVWGSFVEDRPEISAVAFEFATGTRSPERRTWHVQHLIRLRRRAGRPLTLVVRGGLNALSALAAVFESVTYLDTDSYVRTIKRRRLDPRSGAWLPAPTTPGQSLDELLADNVRAVARSVQHLTGRRLLADEMHREPWQPSLLDQASLVERRTDTADR